MECIHIALTARVTQSVFTNSLIFNSTQQYIQNLKSERVESTRFTVKPVPNAKVAMAIYPNVDACFIVRNFSSQSSKSY